MTLQTKTMTSVIRKLLPGVALFSALALPGMPATAAELTFRRIGAGGGGGGWGICSRPDVARSER